MNLSNLIAFSFFLCVMQRVNLQTIKKRLKNVAYYSWAQILLIFMITNSIWCVSCYLTKLDNSNLVVNVLHRNTNGMHKQRFCVSGYTTYFNNCSQNQITGKKLYKKGNGLKYITAYTELNFHCISSVVNSELIAH